MNNRVNSEIAKLLKEKGFDEESTLMYASNGNITDSVFDFDDWCFAPTIADVVMWLYEKHGIWIVPFPELLNGEVVRFYPSIFEQGVGEDIEVYYNSPTEAYEPAIKYCLENLVKPTKTQ